jgi:putative two-component system response regulator
VVLETGWALALRGNGLAVVMLELGRHGPSGSLLTPEAAEHAVQTLACILVDRTRRMDLCARFSAGRFIVVLVDDDQSVVGSLQRLFRRVGYAKPAAISDPRLVEEYVRNEHMDLIILDLHMPELDGFQVLVSLAPLLSPEESLPVLILTGDDSPEVRQHALAAGAMDFLTKPFDMAEAEARVRNLLATRSLTKRVAGHRDLLEEKIWERTAELADTRTEILHRLGPAAEYRDDVTGRHAERVGLMASLLAAELGLDARQVDLIRRTAPLHDVGKIGVAVAAKIARGHHEGWDGGGYPDGTRGVEISLDTRIVAVADVFDVLTHTRPYQGAFPLHEARQIIVDGSGKHFDPDVVEALKVIYDRVGPDKILGLADPIDPMRDIISSRTTTTTPD